VPRLTVRGDDPLKVKQRAGHRTFSTAEGYIREAENLADGFGEVFPPRPRHCSSAFGSVAPGIEPGSAL
jgi:hypothetical protein